MIPKSILAFDLDGTLTPRNQFIIHPIGLSDLLNQLTQLGHIVIPVSGKPASYAEKLFPENALIDSGVIAENAGVYRKPGQTKIEIYGASIKELRELRNYLKIGMDHVNVTKIFLEGREYEVVVDPGDISILTIFTDPSHVSHRWTFTQTISAEELVDKLRQVIIKNRWDMNLEVLPPFPDGGVQLIRKDPTTGKSINKSSLLFALHEIYPIMGNVPIAMFGDGHNDIPAMEPKDVVPITFKNAHPDVLKFVSKTKGYISSFDAPEDYGIVDGIYWLADHQFFGNDDGKVQELIKDIFPDYSYTHSSLKKVKAKV